jgi:hypothetical protein
MNEQVSINGIEVWALIREEGRGIRVRLSLDDWDRCGLGRGVRIKLQRHERPAQWFFLAEHIELPPVAWFNLEAQVSLAG